MPYHPWISRTLAVDHLETANRNGFNHASMGCPIIIADGWLGMDNYIIKEVPHDRSRAAILRFYPEVRAKKLKVMYAKNHPLSKLDTASFGRITEGVTGPKHPKK